MVSGIFPCFQACTVSHHRVFGMMLCLEIGYPWGSTLSPFKTAISGTYSHTLVRYGVRVQEHNMKPGYRHHRDSLLTSSIAARSPAKSLPGAREITPGWQQRRRCVLIQWMVSLGKISRLKVKTMLSTPKCYGQTLYIYYIILSNTVYTVKVESVRHALEKLVEVAPHLHSVSTNRAPKATNHPNW